MAIGHISYKSLPPEVRRHAAERTRKQIRDLMTTNFVTPDQMAFLNRRLQHLDAWEKGNMSQKEVPRFSPAPPPELPERVPTQHSVGIEEDVPVDEKHVS